MRLRVDGPAGRFVLYALHVPRPWFTTHGGYQASLREHHQIIAAVAAQASKERDPVIVVGDLNTSDRTYGYQQLLQTGGLVDAVRDRWTRYSSVGKWTPLLVRIDHILVSRGWCGDGAGQVALPGSDHRGVLATVGPCLPAATP
jgi:endonuclease/exonuclease/phosphatase family metal-dependent hydrolase